MRQALLRITILASLSAACGPASAPHNVTADGELVISVEPRSSRTLFPIFDTPVGGVARADDAIFLALGDEYPEAFDLELESAWFQTCGGELIGAFEVSNVDVGVEGLTATRVSDTVVRLRSSEQGDFTVALSGAFSTQDWQGCEGLAAGEAIDFRIDVAVKVRRPAAVEVDPPDICIGSDSLFIESGAGFALPAVLGGIYPRVLDSEGEALFPANASEQRPVTILVRADPGTELSLRSDEAGLESLVVTGPAGPVIVSSEFGEELQFELIEAEEIDAMDASFSLLGFGGGGSPLESGQTHGETGWARTSASIGTTVTQQRVDGTPVCTLPRAGAFTLRGGTASTCVVHAGLGHGDYPPGTPVGDSADVLESGRCDLHLQADSGLSATLSTVILNAESLIGEGR